MNAHERRQNGLTLLLHLYTKKSCIRKCFSFYPGERHRLSLTAESLQTVFPVELVLEMEGKDFRLNGKKLHEESFCILKTKAGEEIMAVVSRRTGKLTPCGKLSIWGETEIRIGNAFQSEVFYDCFSFIRDKHLRIYKAEEKYILETVSDEGENFAGVYVNGKRAAGKHILSPGDVVELLGLSLLYLPGILVCSAFYGTLRTAERRKRLPVYRPEERGEVPSCRRKIEQAVIEEKQLVTEEVELELPEPERSGSSQPLLLTLGPSATMILPMLLMAVVGSAMLGESGAGYYQISIVMTAASSFLAVFWGLINHIYQKRVSLKERIRRKESYQEYLNKMSQYLADVSIHNREALLIKYPSGKSFLPVSGKNGQVFWNRSIRQSDYLFVRLGLGEIPFQVKVKLSGSKRVLNSDSLTEKAFVLADQYRVLAQVPVGIDLKDHRYVGFTGTLVYPVLLQALLQLAACHDGRNLKLVYFYHEDDEQEKRIANCIRWLPHIWKSGRKMRYLAGNEKEAGEILPELMKELQGRQEKENNLQGVYVFILAAKELIKGEGLYRLLLEAKENSGIYTLFVNRDREMLPGECECLIIRDKDREEVTCYQQNNLIKQQFPLEEISFPETENFMRGLSELSLRDGGGEEEILEEVSFLQLYDCERPEDLNCQGRWRESRTKDRIRVPIGMAAGGRLIYLDVHEKFHGPHGLIAGTTGSGKSELLQTYLLSLAVSFGPEDINFFIIDYKGGGMGNVLCHLPHCAGVVSNLSGRQIKRALASIKSENTRRQQLFHMAGVNHVADYAELYREGKVSEPVPHLLLVVDEFAELKKEEPEFMQEIISVAQVGRSLGVHLILSTQKPAGTVDDKIWSNTRFRLCLRVADKQDSMDMLHRPEAAYLTGAGQCYLQVGNNELYELFQAGYGGTEYDESGLLKEGAYMVSATGKRFFCRKETKEKHPSQMEVVIDYVNRAAEQLGTKAAKPLWMPELSDSLSLEDIQGKEEAGRMEETESVEGREENAAEKISLCIGLCDDPERQQQYPLYYSPIKEGNLCLCGAPAVGKSTFLQTLLFQLCRYQPGQIQFMLAASDNAGVNCFREMPGCLGIMKKKEDAECFFFHIERLFIKRKEELSGINFLQYRKHRENAGAFLFLIIDNYGSFRQMTEDRYEELIEKLAGEGLNYGIYLILTALNVGSGEIPGKLFEKMKVTLSLEMSDKFQYGDVLRQYHMNVLPKENVKGRGLCKKDGRVLEFQVPLFTCVEDDYERISRLVDLAEKKKKELRPEEIPERFPYIPEKPNIRHLLNTYQKGKAEELSIPLGYEEQSGYIVEIQIRNGFVFLISGAEQSGKRNMLCICLRGLWERKVKAVLFDRKGSVAERVKEAAKDAGKEDLLELLADETEFVNWYDSNEKKKTDQEAGFLLCVSDLMDFSDMLGARNGEMIRIRENLEQGNADNRMFPILALCKPGREMEAAGNPVFELIMKQQWGIHLGGNAAGQRLLSFDDLSYMQMNQWEKPGIGYLKRGNGSRTVRIRLPLWEKEEKADDISGCTGTPYQQNL
ncbi:MAG: type VII secretion protein EssC [Suilimivivens sp.]